MQSLYPPASPQSIGQVLDSGFRIFEASLVRSLLYGAVSMIAGQLPNIYFIAAGRPLAAFGGGSPLWVTLYLIGALIMLALYASLLYRQHGIATGQRLGTSVELSMAIRRLPAYVGLVLLSVLILMIVPLIFGLVMALLGIGFVPRNYTIIAIGAGIVGIIVIYLATLLALAPLALLLDMKGPASGIGYAVRLVQGNWWRTTVILTVAVVLVIVFYAVAMVIVGMVLPLAGATDLAAVTAATGVVYVVLGSVGLPFFSAMLLATYGELKVRKEGLDLEQRVADVAQS